MALCNSYVPVAEICHLDIVVVWCNKIFLGHNNMERHQNCQNPLCIVLSCVLKPWCCDIPHIKKVHISLCVLLLCFNFQVKLLFASHARATATTSKKFNHKIFPLPVLVFLSFLYTETNKTTIYNPKVHLIFFLIYLNILEVSFNYLKCSTVKVCKFCPLELDLFSAIFIYSQYFPPFLYF